MSASQVVVLVAVVVVILLIVTLAFQARARAHRKVLRQTFGGEYDVAVADTGSSRDAGAELDRRLKRHEDLQIRPLDEQSRQRYVDDWETLQRRFVDRPQNAVAEADELVSSVMTERGYPPAASFEERAADLSVEHAGVLRSYRNAHDLVSRPPSESSTEELRQAMVEYRRLFEDLVRGDSLSADGAEAMDRGTPA